MTDDEIIKEEMELIVDDIKKLYRQSGKKASGQFEDGLDVVYEPNKATLRGFVYLAGRGLTKKGHQEGEPYLVESILEWIKTKGIRPREANMSITSLAWAIATFIHKHGTDRAKWFNIYEMVITPQRIDKIINRVAQLNVNRIVTEIRAELTILEKGV